RLFIVRALVVGQEAPFTEDAFIRTFHSDFVNDLGNGLSRVMKLSEQLASALHRHALARNLPGTSRPASEWTKEAVSPTALNGFPHLEKTVENDLTIFKGVNQFFETEAPWKLAKGSDADKERLKAVLWHAAEALRIGFTLLHPVMPGKMDEALAALGFTFEESRKQLEWRTSGTFNLSPISPLFPRIEVKKAGSPGGQKSAPETPPADPFSVIDLRVVRILSVENH